LFYFKIIFSIGTIFFANFEEKGCLEQYGENYCEYMKKTPRWIGLKRSK